MAQYRGTFQFAAGHLAGVSRGFLCVGGRGACDDRSPTSTADRITVSKSAATATASRNCTEARHWTSGTRFPKGFSVSVAVALSKDPPKMPQNFSELNALRTIRHPMLV